MLKKYQIADGKLVEKTEGDTSIYVYVNPSDAEKVQLINEDLLDEHTLNSALDPDEVARVEYEANHVAAIIKKPRRYDSKDQFLLKVSPVGVFLFSDKLIIITSDEFIFESRIFSKLRSVRDVYLKIIFMFIRHFEGHIQVIHRMSDELESELNRAMSNKDLFSLFNLEKSLVYYLNAITSNGKVIEKLKNNSAKMGFSQEDSEFLEDVIIENAQCYEQSSTYSQVLASMMDARASIINNNLNIRIKMLTILSICIMAPTFIVSLFSMNVPLPIPHDINSFWFVASLAFLSIIGIVLLWHYRKW